MAVNNFTALAVVSIFIEAFITYTHTIYKEHRIQWQVVIALLASGLLCYNFSLDFFAFLGLQQKFPIVGIICTAVVMSRGSNYFFEFYKQLSSWRKTNPETPDDIPDVLLAPKEELEEVKDEIEQEDVKIANR